MIDEIAENIRQVRQRSPLVVNLTNDVVMNISANMLLACGASPIMAHSRHELVELIQVAQAVVINIGTLDELRVKRMLVAIEAANRFDKLIVLDPVGCGASRYRTQTAQQFAQLAKHLVIRANASEILALAGLPRHGQGVDSHDDSREALKACATLRQQLTDKALLEISISGADDWIDCGFNRYKLSNGVPLMTQITGTGCSLSALTGAFRAVHPAGCISAAAVMSIAGELAAKYSKGPASLQQHLIDELYQMDEETLKANLNIQHFKAPAL
ncbi:hydroxyethylthiazole kinase [Celerinatantimonas sp. MCCC 1A17872]|uniref:hydroxyethylthiazole kinase n=1 Tax=Celerinatantimonas sp. MCCC 1A17872 TaxID=3177514 RepID=UPI0038C63119